MLKPWSNLVRCLQLGWLLNSTLVLLALLTQDSLAAEVPAAGADTDALAVRELRLLTWPDYIDPEVVAGFERAFDARVTFDYFDSDDARDRSFVSDMCARDADRALVAAMIAMAKALGLEVIAEGIETQAQRDLLRDLGCDLGQGYLFARPIQAAEAARFLARRAEVADPVEPLAEGAEAG